MYTPANTVVIINSFRITQKQSIFKSLVSLCELGPRSTGKSHLYKEISPNSILVSGGQTTVANLFYNMGRKTVGLVGLWDCVAFDEVAGINFTVDTRVEFAQGEAYPGTTYFALCIHGICRKYQSKRRCPTEDIQLVRSVSIRNGEGYSIS